MTASAQCDAVAPDRRVPRGDRIFHALVAAGLAAMFAISLEPFDSSSAAPTFSAAPAEDTSCVLRRLTGLPCLTCGITRSFRAIGQGDVAAALEFHPLGPLLWATFLALMVRSAGVAIRGRTWLDRMARWLAWSIPIQVALFICVWAVRVWGFYAGGEGVRAFVASLVGRWIAGG
jgi:hypothetical protein